MKVHRANGAWIELSRENIDEFKRYEDPEKVEKWEILLRKQDVLEPPKVPEKKVVARKKVVAKAPVVTPAAPVKPKVVEATKEVK